MRLLTAKDFEEFSLLKYKGSVATSVVMDMKWKCSSCGVRDYNVNIDVNL